MRPAEGAVAGATDQDARVHVRAERRARAYIRMRARRATRLSVFRKFRTKRLRLRNRIATLSYTFVAEKVYNIYRSIHRP